MLRGELWWADLGLPRGSAPALRRPVLLISADQYNRSNLRTITVAVLTSNAQLAALPGNVSVPADVAGLQADSVVNVTQIAAIDRDALEERIGTFPDWLMAQVDAGLGRALALAHL
jgi:mRNA interferase MazF